MRSLELCSNIGAVLQGMQSILRDEAEKLGLNSDDYYVCADPECPFSITSVDGRPISRHLLKAIIHRVRN